MIGWLARFHLTRPEENPMSEYGPQGAPMSVPTSAQRQPDPAEAPPLAATASLPGDAGVSVDTAETAQPSGLVPPVAQSDEMASMKARLLAAEGLVTAWNNIAETTLTKGDYERGQRDATLTRSDELRKALGI